MVANNTQVEVSVGGTTWLDITSDVRIGQGISISRGLSSEGGQADPSTCTLMVNNDGRFSPRKPTGPYYGLISRNSPLRVSVAAPESHLRTGPGYGGAVMADTAGVSLTGDLDIRVAATGNWRGDRVNLVGKYTADNMSYAFCVDPEGYLQLNWASTASSGTFVRSAVPVPDPFIGFKAVRVTLDVDNGSGGWTIAFYTSTAINGTWTLLGNAGASTPVTSINNSTQNLMVGSTVGSGPVNATKSRWRFHAVEVRSGIGGTVVASPTFTGLTHGATSFTDAQGNAWSLVGDSEIRGRDYRFWGEVSEWPQRWDITGRDVTVALEAGGVMRRLSQGSSPLHSVYYRQATGETPFSNLVAYWPLEDGENSTRLASGLPGGGSGFIRSGTDPGLGQDSSFPCSAPCAVLNDASLELPVGAYSPTGVVQVRLLAKLPSDGVPADAVLFRVHTAGSVARWDFKITSGAQITITAYNSSGTALTSAASLGFALNGIGYRYHFDLRQNGPNVDFQYAILAPGSAVGLFSGGSLPGHTVDRITHVSLGPTLNLGSTAVGHVTVQSAQTSVFEYASQLNAFSGEKAGDRIERLCAEEGVAVSIVGGPADTEPMGYQRVGTLIDLLRECDATDGGILCDARDFLGLLYRTRSSLERRTAALSLSHGGGDVPPLTPTEDDRSVQNDVTVTRAGGSSARVEVASGPMSTAVPPAGIGRYSSQTTLSLWDDQQCEDAAGWAAHLGTVDESRFPSVPLLLESPNFKASATKRNAALAVDVGDMVTITNMPQWLPPDNSDQGVIGYTEKVTEFGRQMTLVCSPASPYRIGVWYSSAVARPARWTSDGTTTTGTLTTTAGSMAVDTPTGPVWSHSDGNFDVMVAGERMTVTAVSGTGAAQTFTVTRSVNGVVKSHVAGETVELADPTFWGL